MPASLESTVVFDQSRFVKTAIETLLHEGGIGLFLTCLMILIFLGSMRATIAVFFSIPLSLLATFFVLQLTGSSINSMVLGGLALALSRLIDNSVVVLENIFRHLEGGEAPSRRGGKRRPEVALPVLAGTLTTVVVFFPGHDALWSQQVSILGPGAGRGDFAVRFVLCGADGGASVLRAVHQDAHGEVDHEVCGRTRWSSPAESSQHHGLWARFNAWFAAASTRLLHRYDALVQRCSMTASRRSESRRCISVCSLLLFPLMGLSFFPRTDAGQFVINFKAPSGTKLDATEEEAAQARRDSFASIVSKHDMGMMVSNHWSRSRLFGAVLTEFRDAYRVYAGGAESEDHQTSSFDYIDEVKQTICEGDAGAADVLLHRKPGGWRVEHGCASADRRSGRRQRHDTPTIDCAQKIAAQIRRGSRRGGRVTFRRTSTIRRCESTIDRTRASELGLTEKEVVSNIITALTSNQMIAPSIWIDPEQRQQLFPDRDVQRRTDQVASTI